MENVKKIKAICDIAFLESEHCKHLSEEQKSEILALYEKRRALIVGFVVNEICHFVAVFELTINALHVWHVVGNFGRYWRELDVFAQGLAKMCGYGVVTFETKRRAVEKWADQANFAPAEIDFVFVKKVEHGRQIQ